MWQNTSESDCRANECVEFFVTADGELKVARRNALDLEILGGVACELEDFGGKVLQDGGQIDRGLGADARLLARDGAEVTLYTTARELQTGQRVIINSDGEDSAGGVGALGIKVRERWLLLTWRPALAECDLEVLTCESPLPPVLPPVFPARLVSF